MSTSLLYHAFGIPTGYQHQSTRFERGEIVFTIAYVRKHRCPCCRSRSTIRRGTQRRRYRTVPIGRKSCFIELDVQRVACESCGQIRFALPSFAPAQCRYTNAFKRLVLSLSSSMTIKALAGYLCVGWDLVKSIQKNTWRSAIACRA